MLPAGVERHRFGVTEYHRMLEVGLLNEDDRVELIRGEIVDMAPIGARHLACVTNLNHILVEQARGRYFVSVKNPVGAVDNSEPQPDFSLLRKLPDPEAGSPPSKEDTLVVIEVSDATLSYDRDVKLPLYAETGIPEAWIIDLKNRRIEVYTEPASDGYRAMRIFGAGERVGSREIEGISVAVDEVLG